MGSNDFKKILKGISKVGIDSVCLIYIFEQNKKYLDLAEYLLRRDNVLCFSTMGVTEILTGVRKAKDEDLFQSYLEFFMHFDKLHILPVDFKIADTASILRAQYNIKTPDAIHLATAIENKASVFITNDKRLKQVKEVKVVCLGEYTKKK